MVYNNNVPLGNQTIASTTDPIRNNFAFLQTGIGQEHNFDTTDATTMYHTQVSMPNFVGAPARPTDTNGLLYLVSGELRYLDGSDRVNRLTQANTTTPGYQYLGRTVMLWGVESVSSGATGNVVFTLSAPMSSLRSLQLTVDRDSSSSVTANFTSASNLGFSYRISAGGAPTQMYWLAIGVAS